MSGWQPIETAPSDGSRILVVGGRWEWPEIALADGEWWLQRARAGSIVGPTHWMPIPTPPT